MAYIKVTSSANCIKADFGIYSGFLEKLRGCWRKEKLSFKLATDHVSVTITGEKNWQISHDGADSTNGATLRIESINGVTLLSNEDIYLKLEELAG